MSSRNVYCVFGARALRYAKPCLLSLLRNCIDPVQLTIITDSSDDADTINSALASPEADGRIRVFTAADSDERAKIHYAGLDNVAWFRSGHPCWRKITDTVLFSEPNVEQILIDPDVYFPNRFRFDRTPQTGVLLMRQKPNCLFPPNAVRATFRAGYSLADKTDIGIAQLVQPIDGQWLDQFVATVGRENLPAWSMHIESIVWAAWAMRAGGGYLNPAIWKCWHNAYWKRAAIKFGMVPWRAVADERFQDYNCFHATGPAKDMLLSLLTRAAIPCSESHFPPTLNSPFLPYSRVSFEFDRFIKGLFRR